LEGQPVGVEATGDGIWNVYFGPVKLGRFDERNAKSNSYLSLKV